MSDQTETDRELTYGEKMVGVSFNPSKNEKVDQLKKLYAEAIDIVHNDIHDKSTGGVQQDTLAVLAVEQSILAQMAAVKSVTWSE
jgi:hypothetical protein